MKEGVRFLLYLEPVGEADATLIADVTLLLLVPLGAQQRPLQLLMLTIATG